MFVQSSEECEDRRRKCVCWVITGLDCDAEGPRQRKAVCEYDQRKNPAARVGCDGAEDKVSGVGEMDLTGGGKREDLSAGEKADEKSNIKP